MKTPLFPLIDITQEGFFGDNCFPVLLSAKINISIKDFNKNFLNSIHYDSKGIGYKISGYELISGSFLSKRKEINLIFTELYDSIDLNSLKQLGIENASQIYFLEDDEIDDFKEKIDSIQDFRELIIHLSEYKEENFE